MDKEKIISLIALRKALDDIGIYPAAISGSNGYEKRTEYMDGYNACSMELTQKWGKISDFITQLPADVRDDIINFIIKDKIQISVGKDTINFWINCNDLFAWACADGEDFELSDLEDFKKAFKDSPDNGDILWCCRKRKMRPQGPCYKYFSKEEKKLFDAAGPKRKD